MDDLTDIEQLYSRDPDREHERLERHQLEHDLTWRYLERYLPASGDILEIGAATGRYTVELARRGYRVTAVDLSAVELDQCRQRLEEAGLADHVTVVAADAQTLGNLPERVYDALLLMGPFTTWCWSLTGAVLWHGCMPGCDRAASSYPRLSAGTAS